MDPLTVDAVSLFEKELQLCKVKAGDLLLLITDDRFTLPYASIFMAAGGRLGADIATLKLPAPREYRFGQKMLDHIKGADLVVDLGTVPWLYSDEHNAILDSGAKVLMCKQPEDTLRRLFPDDSVTKRTMAGAKFYRDKKMIRVTSHYGTDFSLSKAERGVNYQIGYTADKGRWDNWPSGMVGCAPLENSAEGTLVLNPGDIVYSKTLSKFIDTPVRIKLSKGKIREIEGGTDALLLRDWFKQWHDPEAYGTSHIGWGTEHRANWNIIGQDSESFYGGMMIAFGSNFFVGPKGDGLGGTNRSKAHIDIVLRNCNFFTDEKKVLSKGKIVIDSLK